MELFIRIQNNQPFEHPIFGDNFRQAFPHVDVNNLPAEFARFERIQAPILGPYEKNQRVQYERRADGVYHDVWYCDPMSDAEKKEKQDFVKAQWAENNGFASWAFNENTCAFEAPVLKPEDGNNYAWRESDLSWVLIPTPPQGEGWTFSVETGTWVKP